MFCIIYNISIISFFVLCTTELQLKNIDVSYITDICSLRLEQILWWYLNLFSCRYFRNFNSHLILQKKEYIFGKYSCLNISINKHFHKIHFDMCQLCVIKHTNIIFCISFLLHIWKRSNYCVASVEIMFSPVFLTRVTEV